jgi:hypothetical protein
MSDGQNHTTRDVLASALCDAANGAGAWESLPQDGQVAGRCLAPLAFFGGMLVLRWTSVGRVNDGFVRARAWRRSDPNALMGSQ